MKAINMYYKYCITPQCRNTTVTAPNKVFIRLPSDVSRRAKWMKACNRDPKSISVRSKAHVCEDHFNLQEDLENFIKFKILGGKMKVKMKRNVVPHIFDHQANRKSVLTHVDMSGAPKQENEFVHVDMPIAVKQESDFIYVDAPITIKGENELEHADSIAVKQEHELTHLVIPVQIKEENEFTYPDRLVVVKQENEEL